MFTVYLYEGEECIAQIQDIFEINADLKLNGSSQVKITLDAQSPYIQRDLLRMWRSIRITELTEEGEKEMLAGVIRWVEANFTQVEIIAESRRVLLEKRLVEQKYKWSKAPLEEVVRTLFEEQNRKSPLPFNVECETGSTVSLEVGEKAVLSSVINSIIKEGVDVFLIGDTLKIGKHIWEDRTQGANYKEFRYDTQDPEGNTIDKAKLVIDAKEMSNKVWGQRSEESIARYGLLEESKSNEDEVTYLKEHKEQVSEFNITVGEDSFYQVELGDKVKVIIKGYNELMQFDGIMKIVGKKYRSGDLPTIEYTVSTQRIPQEWVIGTIKQLSEKVNQKSITTTWPQVDLSWYATSSAVNQAIQSQNTKIEKKADSSFVQWVAQTAQTALNTANQAKQTAESKAPIQHTHNKSEVWLDQVDNTSDEDKPLSKATKKALELKCSFADIVDNLNTEAIKPLSAKQGKVLKEMIDRLIEVVSSEDTDLDSFREIAAYIKQNKKILSQLGISNIVGLVEALEGKANKVHTHTKSQISDFPTSMPASDVHEWAKKNKKPDYAWDEINNKPETFTPSTHKHKATDIENIGEVVTQAAVKKALGGVSSDQDGYLTSGDYNKIFPKNGETRGNPLDYEKMTINTMGANRLAFLNPEQVLVETSTDWTNWGEYALADNKKRNLFNGLNGSNDEIQVGKDMQIRVTLDSWINNKSERYVTLEKLYLRTTTSGDNISVKIEKANVGAPDKWILVSDYSGGASNRPGNIVVQHPSILFGCYNNQQTNNWRKVRITIKVVNPQAKFAKYKRWLWGIKWFGMSVYTAPNTMMKYGSLFAWDNDQNAIFPGLVKSSATPMSNEDLVNKKYVDDLDIPTVPDWAKQENKPDYDWNEIKNKPETFTPSDHNHNQSYHTKEEIAQLLSALPNVPENMLTAGNLNNRVREISGWIVVPGNGSGSASIYLRHPNGRMYEFFSDGNGAFGVRDKTNNRDVFRITPNETIFYKELNANNLKIKNLADPNNNKDAANKQYVDKKITEVNTALQNLGQTNQQVLTKAEWKALTKKDPNKIYFVKGVWVYVGEEKIIANDTPWFKMMQ